MGLSYSIVKQIIRQGESLRIKDTKIAISIQRSYTDMAFYLRDS